MIVWIIVENKKCFDAVFVYKFNNNNVTWRGFEVLTSLLVKIRLLPC
jgi:hypothetical protein